MTRTYSEKLGERQGELFEKVLWEAVKREEIEEFQTLLTEIKTMLLEHRVIDKWLK